MTRRGAYSNLAGVRLPSGRVSRRAECFRCATEERRPGEYRGRVLREYAIVGHGVLMGTVRLCDPCTRLLVPLNADPLDVQTGT